MSKKEQLVELFSTHRFLSASAIREAGIPSQFITDMVRAGEIVRVACGVYSLADISVSETDDLELLSYLVPSGVICLVSALRFHKLTDENPHEISIAIRQGYHAPKIAYPPVQFFTLSDTAYSSEIKIVPCNGTNVRVYSLEKTIADCFKFRNKIGLDIAIAALREAASQNRIDYTILWNAAKICRVTKIIRPYMESVQ